MKHYETEIVVRTQFRGFHAWKSAPLEVGFLRNLHRHIFHVELRLAVAHDDRDLEFFMVQRALDDEIKGLQRGNEPLNDIHTWSCETWAKMIINAMSNKSDKYEGSIRSCSVFEDNENGAVVRIRSTLTYTGPQNEREHPKRGSAKQKRTNK